MNWIDLIVMVIESTGFSEGFAHGELNALTRDKPSKLWRRVFSRKVLTLDLYGKIKLDLGLMVDRRIENR